MLEDYKPKDYISKKKQITQMHIRNLQWEVLGCHCGLNNRKLISHRSSRARSGMLAFY